MRFWIRIALALTLASAAPARARDQEPKMTLWEGTIGSSKVVVEIKEFPNDAQWVACRYFEVSELHDHSFKEGHSDADGHIHLEMKRDPGDDVVEQLDLKPKNDDLIGEWQGAKGKKKRVQLHRVDIAALRAGKDGERYRRGGVADYDALRLSHLDVRRVESTTFAGHRLQWWLEPRSKSRFFQVESGYDAEALARLNAVLTARLWKEAKEALECTSGGRSDEEKVFYDIKVTPRFLDPRFLSISVWVGFLCAETMHPYYGDYPLNLDVRTGRELALEDVLWLGPRRPAAARNRERIGRRLATSL